MPNPISVYISTFPTKTQSVLNSLRALIQEIMPDSTETISYGIPTIKINGKNALHFAGYKNHIGFYPTPETVEHFKPLLKSYKISKGTVQFPLDQPLPYGLIKEMIIWRSKLLSKKK